VRGLLVTRECVAVASYEFRLRDAIASISDADLRCCNYGGIQKSMKKKIGRPPLPKSIVRNRTIRFKVNDVEFKHLVKEAKKVNWSVAAFVRFMGLNMLLQPHSVKFLKSRSR
jgi:hypothetical protein